MLNNSPIDTISFNFLGRFEDWRVKVTPSNGTCRTSGDISSDLLQAAMHVQSVMIINIREKDCICDGEAKCITIEGKSNL